MNVAIDSADWHEEDAGSERRASYHIAVFLWWCAERELAGPEIDRAAIAKDPVGYFRRTCDGTLTADDLSPKGAAFAAVRYRDYLNKVGTYAQGLGVGNYELPQDAATAGELFKWLDAKLEESRV